ncbi:MAG: diguanylate cyclase [Luteimonas sp.]
MTLSNGSREHGGTPAAQPTTEPARRMPLHQLVHPFRILGMGLSALPVGMVLLQHQASWASWAFLLFTSVFWPHVAHWRVVGSTNPDRIERQNLLIDSAIAGLMLPLMHFNLLPSALIATLATVDKINSGVRGLWFRSLPCMLGGIALGSVFTGFAFHPQTDMAVILACMPILLIHTTAVSVNNYRLVRRVQYQNVRLDQLSRTDPLTGLDNRRQWEEHAQRLLQGWHAGDGPASLVMVDIDSFKTINDGRGHAVGDDVLRAIASVLQDSIGPDDHAARYGGDEFALVLAVDEARAAVVAERICRQIRELAFPAAAGLRCTASLGVAGATNRDTSLRRWMIAADAALYRAKRLGRDRVCTLAETPSGSARTAAP